MKIEILPQHRKAYALLKPLLAAIFERQIEDEQNNALVGQISLSGMRAGEMQPGRIQMLDELLPEILDPLFEAEPKRTIGVPFTKR